MPTTDYTEFLHNVKQEFITNSYELDGTFIFDIYAPYKWYTQDNSTPSITGIL